MNKVYIFNETHDDVSDEIKTLRRLMKFATNHERLENIEFNIIFVDSKKIREINKNYRNIDRVTDVISFALFDNETRVVEYKLLGDIYICLEKARSQALEYEHSFLREVCFLAVHGFYHLLGYDHMNDEDAKVMFSKQDEILEGFGIRR